MGADIGGYKGSPMPDLLTRWIELGAFNPVFRDHTEKGSLDQEPWVHGPEHEAIRKRYIELRYQLMPYTYTLAEEASRTGVPMMRPIFLEFPNERDQQVDSSHADSEFFWGRSLLVAPQPFETLDTYQVGLPAADWYDYWTGQRIDSSKPAVIRPKLDELPVFVRGGSIIPQQPVVQSTEEQPEGPLELRVYPGKDCQGSLYLDDGKTFNYRRGAFLRENFTCEVEPGAVRVRIAPHEGTFQPWWKQIEVSVYGAAGPARSVRAGNAAVSEVRFDEPGRVVRFRIDDAPGGSDVRIEYQ